MPKSMFDHVWLGLGLWSEAMEQVSGFLFSFVELIVHVSSDLATVAKLVLSLLTDWSVDEHCLPSRYHRMQS